MWKKTTHIFLLILLLTSVASIFLFSTLELTNNSFDVNDLRSSDPDITIITPQNKTYLGPMSGYYPATYGFENDEIGTYPKDWNVTQNPSIINEIIAELDGHKKVFHMDKGDTYGISNSALQYFAKVQEYGAIEFWARTSNVLKESSWHLKSGVTNHLAIAGIRMCNNAFEYWLGSDWQEVAYTANNNQWYHIKMQFECGTGNHYGLSQHYWRFYVNNVEFGDYAFISSCSNVSHIIIHQNWRYSNYHTYTDAIGYSWDPNYNIGDNKYEGLLLNFDTSFTPDWVGYSLNDQTIKSIKGNTVIPYPSVEGIYSIQVFGNNSIGTMYQSDIRYFTIGSSPTIPPGLPIELVIIIIVLVSVGSAVLVFVTYFVYNKTKTRLPLSERKPTQVKIKKQRPSVESSIFSCPFCQAELPGGQKFCVYCGAKLEE